MISADGIPSGTGDCSAKSLANGGRYAILVHTNTTQY